MSNQLIRAVLLDYGGGIADGGFRNGLIEMAHEQRLDLDLMLSVAKRTIYDSGFVLGWGTEGEFLERIDQTLR